jgi:hypothetical protein
VEHARIDREEADRLALVEHARIDREEADRLALVEHARIDREEAELKEWEEIQRVEKARNEEHDRVALLEADRVARAEADRLAHEQQERMAHAENALLAKKRHDLENFERLALLEQKPSSPTPAPQTNPIDLLITATHLTIDREESTPNPDLLIKFTLNTLPSLQTLPKTPKTDDSHYTLQWTDPITFPNLPPSKFTLSDTLKIIILHTAPNPHPSIENDLFVAETSFCLQKLQKLWSEKIEFHTVICNDIDEFEVGTLT